MYQKREQPKRANGDLVRTISQHFENFVVDDKANCKCGVKDLGALENVHLVKNRRQMFEENVPVPKDRFKGTNIRNSNANSGNKFENGFPPKLVSTNINHTNLPDTKNNHVVLRTKKSLKDPDKKGDVNVDRKSQSTNVDGRRKSQSCEDNNNNVTIVSKGEEETNVEDFRSYVIDSIIADYNNKDFDNNLDVHDEEIKKMEDCEEVVNDLIKSQSKRSLYALTISHKFVQSLLATDRKSETENSSTEYWSNKRRSAPGKISNTTQSILLDHLDENEENETNATKLKSPCNYTFKENSVQDQLESMGRSNGGEETNSTSSYCTSDSDSVFEDTAAADKEEKFTWVGSEPQISNGEPMLLNYKSRAETDVDQPIDTISQSNEIINRAISNIVSVADEFGKYDGDDKVDKHEKLRPRLNRFNRIQPRRRKFIYGMDISVKDEDEDDLFGSMIDESQDYCVEVINADDRVVVNKISLQRVCISNILYSPAQKFTAATEHKPSKDESKNIVSPDGIEIDINIQDGFDFTPANISIRTTTYYDQNSNPRIEKVIDENMLRIETDDRLGPPLITPTSPTPPNRKQNLIIKELLETETTFIEGLRIVIDEYLAYFREHQEKVTHQINHVFGNVEEIYKEAQNFYINLTICNYNIEKVARTFLEHRKLFELYVEYIRNKPLSQFYSGGIFHNALRERHGQLQERQQLESYLLTPIQRLGRYILFMENLQKVGKTLGQPCVALDEATDFLKGEMRRADTFVAAGSIGYCPHDLAKKGAFLIKETFNIKKKYKSVVFLFEKIVVFTIQNQQRSESFFYKDSIDMSDLNIRTTEEQPLVFHLRNYSKCKIYQESPHNFELEAPSEKIKQKWVTEIESLLWNQLLKFKENQSLHGEQIYKKGKKVAHDGSNLPNYYKKKRPPEIPTTPSPTENNERQSVFYVQV